VASFENGVGRVRSPSGDDDPGSAYKLARAR
jgi:hypothetical protein